MNRTTWRAAFRPLRRQGETMTKRIPKFRCAVCGAWKPGDRGEPRDYVSIGLGTRVCSECRRTLYNAEREAEAALIEETNANASGSPDATTAADGADRSVVK